jgi:DNA-binding beta-propeller fold protein YncE
VGDFMKPKGVAVDSSGMIYVCDSLRDAVQVYDADNRFVMTFGERGQNPGNFWMPSGLYIDSNDTIYVGDTYNNRIQIFQSIHAAAPGSGPGTPVPGLK